MSVKCKWYCRICGRRGIVKLKNMGQTVGMVHCKEREVAVTIISEPKSNKKKIGGKGKTRR